MNLHVLWPSISSILGAHASRGHCDSLEASDLHEGFYGNTRMQVDDPMTPGLNDLSLYFWQSQWGKVASSVKIESVLFL